MGKYTNPMDDMAMGDIKAEVPTKTKEHTHLHYFLSSFAESHL